VFVTTDSGHSWRNASPGAVTNPSFYTPLAMDPLHANHLVTGGREVVDAVAEGMAAARGIHRAVESKR